MTLLQVAGYSINYCFYENDPIDEANGIHGYDDQGQRKERYAAYPDSTHPTTYDTDGDGMSDQFEQQLVDADPNDALNAITDIHPTDDLDSDGYTVAEEWVNRLARGPCYHGGVALEDTCPGYGCSDRFLGARTSRCCGKTFPQLLRPRPCRYPLSRTRIPRVKLTRAVPMPFASQMDSWSVKTARSTGPAPRAPIPLFPKRESSPQKRASSSALATPSAPLVPTGAEVSPPDARTDAAKTAIAQKGKPASPPT